MAHKNVGKKPKTISELFTSKSFEFTFVSIFADMTIRSSHYQILFKHADFFSI